MVTKNNVIPYYIVTAVCFLIIVPVAWSLQETMPQHSGVFLHFKPLHSVSDQHIQRWLRLLEVHLLSSLVSLAFLIFLGILIYHTYLKLPHHGLMRRCQLRHQNAHPDSDDNDELNFERGRGYLVHSTGGWTERRRVY